ncbi:MULTISPECIES: exodeoxyribonuclease VII large subunit [unclassified Aureimonas]|uniref:exodeoxyribonuclease VII large subunit n=1 Tax=unclassified Aureimonas TaxID=2615206 RepID=UPI0006F5250D|nr:MULTISPECIES: exodeoxyribonuclease VII large subunit [unclassified Aureimonas]KQT69765.1 exodeoxyribonuclease VII large subunit [Aureimonas sp. Leaf427]KQT76083.1 exodeoxyribonuclease VII large subunit [Aureimonas sp. Leaf460]
MSQTDQPASNLFEYSVSELSGALKRTVEERFDHVRVRGEISGYRGPHSSGHAYFALKDDRARLEAVVWRTSFGKLAFKPEEGLEVIATGKLTTYPGSSKYQIVIEQMEPAGAGALMALLNERRQKLEAEGLFAESAKKPIPYMPRVIGIVTSPTGAVIRDIRHRIADRFPVHLLVWPVRVQGETSGNEVAAGIAGLNALDGSNGLPRPDLIIVARGGGSLEDLWGFNDEAVVRAAAASDIPLISAVGHETDWTLIDHAADRRAPTPTGAAEMAVPVRADLLAGIAALHARHSAAISRRFAEERRGVAALARGLPTPDMLLALPRRRLDESANEIGRCLALAVGEKRRAFGGTAARLSPQNLEALVRHKRAELRHGEGGALHALQSLVWKRRQAFDRTVAELRPHQIGAMAAASRHRLDTLATRLDGAMEGLETRNRAALLSAARIAASLDPRQVLKRGYAIIRDADNRPITRAEDLVPGLEFEVEFSADQRRSAIATGAISPDATAATAAKPRPAKRAAKAVLGGQGTLF